MQAEAGASGASGVQSRMMSPEEILTQGGDQTPFLVFPDSSVFLDRASRLNRLADGHAMQDYLRFVAVLTESQQAVLAEKLSLHVPTVDDIHKAIDSGRPLLDAQTHARDPQWVEMLRKVLQPVAAQYAHLPVADLAKKLLAMDVEEINRLADRLIHGYTVGLDLGVAQLVAAGLQVYFTALVQQTQSAYAGKRPEPFGRIPDLASVCPCCASRPVASVTRIGAEQSGYRYVSCSLCSTQWHVVRIKCVACENTKGIVFESLKSESDTTQTKALRSPEAVQAECCDECGQYLKVVHMEKDQFVEPHADDLATVSLDLLVAESGKARYGNNLMLLFGTPPDAEAEPPGSVQ